MSRLLLASDLDGTLVGDPAALEVLNAGLGSQRDRWVIAYVTGRTLDSTLSLLAETPLLRPDLLVTGVGSEIHWGPGLEPDVAWRRRMGRGWSRERVRAIASFFPALVSQPPHCQGPFKCSYTLAVAPSERTLEGLVTTMRRQRLRARLIYSSGRDLDVVPIRSGKGNAVRYVAERLGIPPEGVLACGDSGNDLDMLAMGGSAVVVANAQPELLASAPLGAYRARAPYAAGIHEALVHFGYLLGATSS